MKLTESLPDHIDINGEQYTIYTDFRRGIRHEQMLQYDPNVTVGDILCNWLPIIPDDLGAALEAVDAFYYCGQMKMPKTDPKQPPKKTKRLYDFDVDSDAIVASFRQCYGICLHTTQLHWWEFCELLNGLPQKCAFSDRVQIRGADTKGMKSKERRQIEELKRRWRLPDTLQARRRKYTTLDERNAAMIAYVDKRFAETTKAKG